MQHTVQLPGVQEIAADPVGALSSALDSTLGPQLTDARAAYQVEYGDGDPAAVAADLELQMTQLLLEPPFGLDDAAVGAFFAALEPLEGEERRDAALNLAAFLRVLQDNRLAYLLH